MRKLPRHWSMLLPVRYDGKRCCCVVDGVVWPPTGVVHTKVMSHVLNETAWPNKLLLPLLRNSYVCWWFVSTKNNNNQSST